MEWSQVEKFIRWQPEYAAPVTALAAFTIGFIVYYFTIMSEKLEARFVAQHGEAAGQARWIIFQRIWGGAWLGIPPLLLAPLILGKSPADYGMSFGLNATAGWYILLGAAIIIPLNLFRAGKPANLEQYPQIRMPEWDRGLFFASSMGWIIYLLGYEIAFRGFLLYGCLDGMGFWPAVAINASLYSFAHFFKGMDETIAAIPFGIAISIITIHTGNFMTAFIIHCFLALSNQTVAFWKHPDMKLVSK